MNIIKQYLTALNDIEFQKITTRAVNNYEKLFKCPYRHKVYYIKENEVNYNENVTQYIYCEKCNKKYKLTE